MPNYMLLLYAPDADETEREARWGELPLWEQVTDEMRAAGLLLANGALHPIEAATTVRVRDDDVEL